MTSIAFELDGPRTGRHALRGWDVVLAIAAGEAEVAFWLEHAGRLTTEEKRALSAGRLGVIRRPLQPSWSVGDWLPVADNLDIKIESVDRWFKRGSEGYRTTFLIRDFRPTLPRRVPQVLDAPTFDINGEPLPPTVAAIAAARVDGSYTQAPSLAVPGIEEEVGVDVLERYAEQGRVNHNLVHAERSTKRDIRTVAQKLRRVQGEAARIGVDISPDLRELRDQVERLERKLKDVA